jgi:hypothetical protein
MIPITHSTNTAVTITGSLIFSASPSGVGKRDPQRLFVGWDEHSLDDNQTGRPLL